MVGCTKKSWEEERGYWNLNGKDCDEGKSGWMDVQKKRIGMGSVVALWFE